MLRVHVHVFVAFCLTLPRCARRAAEVHSDEDGGRAARVVCAMDDPAGAGVKMMLALRLVVLRVVLALLLVLLLVLTLVLTLVLLVLLVLLTSSRHSWSSFKQQP